MNPYKSLFEKIFRREGRPDTPKPLKTSVREDVEPLSEMANLPVNRTGLSHGIIYVSNRQGQHGPRIKYYRKNPGRTPSASISIAIEPEILEDSIGISTIERDELFIFVRKNYTFLLKIWNEGEQMTIDEWLDGIRKI